MIRLLTDEDFNNAIAEGVRRRLPQLNLVRVQVVGLRSLRDAQILRFAATDARIVLSHDVTTMEPQAKSRILIGESMPGLFLIHQSLSVGTAIDEIVTIAECSRQDEWNDSIIHLPLR